MRNKNYDWFINRFYVESFFASDADSESHAIGGGRERKTTVGIIIGFAS